NAARASTIQPVAFISSKRLSARWIIARSCKLIVAASETAVGQKRLRQFGRGLDAFKHLEAAAESGVGLGRITHGLVNLSERGGSRLARDRADIAPRIPAPYWPRLKLGRCRRQQGGAEPTQSSRMRHHVRHPRRLR